MAKDLSETLSLFFLLLWVLTFRSGSGDRVWSPTVSEDGKTSPYTEPDSQVTTVYSGFTQFTGVSLDFNSHPLKGAAKTDLPEFLV